ncbi:hypothetical protein [Apilactobacillus bombintestini]|uniref:DUF3784 domain-containing protein n=1 Tax=Apilactobacillus bombintestini TaxID=2419772 RepID=A0A387AVR8_9LACO|nr:hypothetical protein [Apilactobacillus bombintestini]AYF92786.1 hypothetical protein D7I45_04545 [Apilactobacillus bombintestini]
MLIKILLAIVTLVLFTIGRYLYTHSNKPFMLLHPEENTTLSKTVKFFSKVFIILTVLSFIAIFFSNVFFITTIMVLSCIMLLVMELILVNFIPKK